MPIKIQKIHINVQSELLREDPLIMASSIKSYDPFVHFVITFKWLNIRGILKKLMKIIPQFAPHIQKTISKNLFTQRGEVLLHIGWNTNPSMKTF